MPFTIEFLKTAEKELAALPKEAQRRIVTKIESLKADPRPPGIKQLKGPDRVIYIVEEKRLIILVVRIANRKGVYDGEASSMRVHSTIRLNASAWRTPPRLPSRSAHPLSS